MKIYQVNNRTNNKNIARRALKADTFYLRLKGLLLTKQLDSENGLIIEPCQAIHMFFMTYSIDVIFYDKNQYVVALVEAIKPWQFSQVYPLALACIELPVGTIMRSGTKLNDQLDISLIN